MKKAIEFFKSRKEYAQCLWDEPGAEGLGAFFIFILVILHVPLGFAITSDSAFWITFGLINLGTLHWCVWIRWVFFSFCYRKYLKAFKYLSWYSSYRVLLEKYLEYNKKDTALSQEIEKTFLQVAECEYLAPEVEKSLTKAINLLERDTKNGVNILGLNAIIQAHEDVK